MAPPVFRSEHLEFIQWVFSYLTALQLLVLPLREEAAGAYLRFVGVCATKATVCVCLSAAIEDFTSKFQLQVGIEVYGGSVKRHV